VVDDERDGVRLTSLDAPLGDGLEVTKGDLVDHLDTFADRLVPLLTGRPLSVMRVRPGQQPFMQRNVAKGAPEWVRTVAVWSAGAHREVHQVLCDDRRTLLWLANQRAVEFHVPFVRTGEEEPTGIVLDLDPPEDADFDVVVRAADLVRRALDDAGLAGAVKTSGSKGVHVVVPVRRRERFPEVFRWAKAVGEELAASNPRKLTLEFLKDNREGRIYVDVRRNAYAQHAVAPYAVRPRESAPVALPIHWDELSDRGLKPDRWTLRTAPERLESDGDAWHGMRRHAKSLPRL
jgi:bifunctional non-homologous end joining protein LigD